MKHLTYNLLSITALVIVIWIASAHSATVTTPPKAGTQRGTAAPPAANTQTAPKSISPVTSPAVPCLAVATTGMQTPTSAGGSIAALPAATATMGPTYVGPTPNITAVANAISLRSKSLTTLITFKTGLMLTKPVAITIGYSSPAAQYRIGPQAYDVCNGNRYLYNDPISGAVGSPGYSVWGKPREMDINITLTEANPAGQPYVYNIPLKINLDPLFDVSISPLRFTMTTDCDAIGDSEIRLYWTAVDAQQHEKSFSANKNRPVTVNEFAWARQEVSGSAKLFFPQWYFYEYDPIPTSAGAYLEGLPPPTTPLLPSGGGYVGRHLTDSHRQGSCEADTAFDIKVELRKYDNL